MGNLGAYHLWLASAVGGGLMGSDAPPDKKVRTELHCTTPSWCHRTARCAHLVNRSVRSEVFCVKVKAKGFSDTVGVSGWDLLE